MERQYTLVLSARVYNFLKDVVEYAGAATDEVILEVDERLITDAIVEINNAKVAGE